MPFSHHSHSGQFCGHATNTLEEMVQTAIAQKMEVYCLTEHMPREAQDLYPEEIEETHTWLDGDDDRPPAMSLVKEAAVVGLARLFEGYYKEATRLREKYGGQITILIGMEIDWIRPSSREWIQALLDRYPFDLFVGSVHHVHGIPIDYHNALYREAREKSGGTDEKLYEEYFDLQFEMLKALKPPVVGHFDLIRLKSDAPDASMEKGQSEDECLVWQKILRNLDCIRDYGGIIEINSAALRKGLGEPYPNAEICREIIARGIQVTLSDDAHGVDQIGTNYAKALAFAEETGFDSLVCLGPVDTPGEEDPSRFAATKTQQIGFGELKKHRYFS
ncbi:MAG: hypothetical protein Q9217_007087 [Psora testacea]